MQPNMVLNVFRVVKHYMNHYRHILKSSLGTQKWSKMLQSKQTQVQANKLDSLTLNKHDLEHESSRDVIRPSEHGPSRADRPSQKIKKIKNWYMDHVKLKFLYQMFDIGSYQVKWASPDQGRPSELSRTVHS